MRIHGIAAIAILLATTTAACGGARGGAPSQAPARAPQYVTIQNGQLLDVAVYIVRGGSRMRIGTANGLGTTHLRLPPTAMIDGTVRLLIDPIGSSQVWVTDPIIFGQRQRIELNIASQIQMSSFSVRSY